mmetsp:Transcript_815/g.1453  ORF Transcript_815/g.1453 Transcript_815/m.1453 type:complete len:503 (-) Transcript_815:742-2250(-)
MIDGRSISQASMERSKEMSYDDNISQRSRKRGISHLMVEDGDQIVEKGANRFTEFSNGQETYTNATQGDRFLTSDASMIRGPAPGFKTADKHMKERQGQQWSTYQEYNQTPYKSDHYGGKPDYNELRSYNTPSAMMDRTLSRGKSEANDFDPMQKRNFTRDDFRQMINRTYNDFYGKFRDQFNPEEYMQCVDNEDLLGRFSSLLGISEENPLNIVNMPSLDLGNIPTTHSFMRTESQQVYYIPHNRNPELIYVKYSQVQPRYKSADLQKRFDNSSLPSHQVTFKEFQGTINLASTLMKNYRGKILLYDMLGWGTIGFGMFVIMMMGIGTSNSTQPNWGNLVLFILLYFILVPIIYKISKCFQCKYLRQAHFVLAVTCRAENNRHYLKRNIEVRPGYLASWIEFCVVDTDNGRKQVIEVVRERQFKIMEETQKNAEEDHMRVMDGVNRNLNATAIDLRIKIEEAKLQRPLSDAEKQEIVNAQLARPGSQFGGRVPGMRSRGGD